MVLQEQLASLEVQMLDMKKMYEEQIKNLSEENFNMLADL